MPDCSVRLQSVHLTIPVYLAGQQRLLRKPQPLSSVGATIERANGTMRVRALRDISVTLDHGEHLGLIGHNGAGKSCLLRLIAGIYPPSRGTVRTNGSVGCLFEMGTGSSPEMTGYETIKHHLLVHRLPREAWQAATDDVAEFTELGQYLDLPIRTYSDGMRARLLAALATTARHDILLIDEGIGAGDSAFQQKFNNRLNRYMGSAGLLIVASHNAALLRDYCSRGMVLEHGEVKFLGGIEEALECYDESISKETIG